MRFAGLIFGKTLSRQTGLYQQSVLSFFSFEFCLLSNSLFYTPGADIDHLVTIYVKTVLPVLWGMASFVLMWLGMRYRTRVLRIISLTLFSITLIKLFVFDIENIAAAGKIVAFFCLGVLLLIISFMYRKVKNIISNSQVRDRRIKVVLLLITGLTCLGIPGWTQSAYRYKADLQKVDTSGVYKIKINAKFCSEM